MLPASMAVAQSTGPSPSANDPQLDAPGIAAKPGEANPDIVVTGTLIHGIAPAGATATTVSRQQIEQSGASTTAQLMQSIPQLPSFNAFQFPSSGFGAQTSNRPNLRDVPNDNFTGASSTLVLIDGHRFVGLGIASTTADPDLIPPDMLERVEIVTGSGSAIYGSDARAGVINFVTRKQFKGLLLDAHYGFAHDYSTVDANASYGKQWSTGSAFVSYTYSRHDPLLGRDLAYVHQPPASVAGIPFPVTGLRCTPGNVQLLPSGTVFALPYARGLAVPNTANQCDENRNVAFYPLERRHAVFAGLTQDLGSKLTLDIGAWYSSRTSYQPLGQDLFALLLGPAIFGLPADSPFRPAYSITGSPFEVQRVFFAVGNGEASNGLLHSSAWGVTPTLTMKLDKSWRLDLLTSLGESNTVSHARTADAAAVNNAVNAGLLNPYSPQTSDPAALAAVQNFETFGKTRQRLANARLVADGNLAALPGGPAKLAAGAEFLREELRSQIGQAVPGFQDTGSPALSLPLTTGALALIEPARAPLPVVSLGRNVWAVFGDLSVPVVGKGNRWPGLEQLTLSASLRYDRYSDFGSAVSPKLGLSYRPLDWIELRGAWGKGFVAPSLADNARVNLASLTYVNGAAVLFPPAALIANGTWPMPLPDQTTVAVLQGTQPGLKAQTAQTWSAGVELTPPFVPGLNLGASYWKILNSQDIVVPPVANPELFWVHFPNSIVVNPNQAQLNAALGAAGVVQGSLCAPLPGCLYAILDIRKRNVGLSILDGVDFHARYERPTRFGSLDFSLEAVYQLHVLFTATQGVGFDDGLAANANRFRMLAHWGASIDTLQISLNLRHSAGFRLDPAVGLHPQQTHVGAFDTIDLFAGYNVPAKGPLSGLSLSLSIQNLFDAAPPAFRQSDLLATGAGFANGETIGRLIQFGIAKSF